MGQTLSIEVQDIIKEQVKTRKNAHFMLVDGMSKLMNRKITNCLSSDIHVGGLKWNMIIFPDEESLTFGLMITDSKCIGSNWKVKCSFELTIVSQTTGESDISHRFAGRFNENCHKFGEKSFISLKDLKEKFILADKAVFCAEITEVNPKSLDLTCIPRTLGTAERIKLMDVARENSRFTWKITQFSSFNGEHHSSYAFTVGPRKWYLQMYPKGNLEGKGNSLSLFLHASDYVNNGPKTRTLAVCKLRVLDQLKRNHHEVDVDAWFHYDSNAAEISWGDPKFLPLEELHKASRGFLVNDEIYIGVEFLLISTTENI